MYRNSYFHASDRNLCESMKCLTALFSKIKALFERNNGLWKLFKTSLYQEVPAGSVSVDVLMLIGRTCFVYEFVSIHKFIIVILI